MTNSEYGIILHYSGYFSIYGNNITNNEYGIWLAHSPANSVYHNNFVNNTEQVYRVDLTNVWDNDYPSGGNYWSDYEEMYPEAEELNGSGIWGTPYLIDENNQDNYPLMSLWINGENGDGSDNGDSDNDILITHPFWMQWWFWTIVAIVIVASAGVVYSFKKRKKPSAPLPSVQD
jgi:parallel beta-helix repeat protein